MFCNKEPKNLLLDGGVERHDCLMMSLNEMRRGYCIDFRLLHLQESFCHY